MFSLLWITPKWPLPAHDGARVATCNLLRGLTKQGYQIDLVALAGHDELVDLEQAQKSLGVQRARVIRRSVTQRSKIARMLGMLQAFLRAPLLPITMRHFGDSEIRNSLSTILAEQQRQAVVYDGLHPAFHASCKGLYRRPESSPACIIYRAHNREASIWSRTAAQSNNFLIRLFLRYQARLVRRFENSLASQAVIAGVSENDIALFRADVAGIRAQVVRIGYDFIREAVPPASDQPNRILYVGTLDWPPNHDGLRWFLERIWPRVSAQRPSLELHIVGSGEPGNLRALFSQKNCHFWGRVESTEAFYQQAMICIVPIFYGSGTRVKAIEAARFSRACISTAIGVEGLNLQPDLTYLQAENEAQWIEVLLGLQPQRALQMGIAARDKLREEFSIERAVQDFSRLLDEAERV